VRPCPTLAGATVGGTDPNAYFRRRELGAWDSIRAGSKLVRLGLDAYAFAMVAAGAIVLAVESGLKPWDIEPCIPVIEGAGGLVTDWAGAPVGPDAGQIAAAGDRACLEEALAALGPAAS
jgi:fructose-1,6-bisphosphatase/inositol monophosphatase family enzyme